VLQLTKLTLCRIGYHSCCITNSNNNNSNNENIYGAVIVHKATARAPGSCDEYGTARSGRRPSHQAKRPGLSAPEGLPESHTHNRHLLLLLSPTADPYFTIPRRVEG